ARRDRGRQLPRRLPPGRGGRGRRRGAGARGHHRRPRWPAGGRGARLIGDGAAAAPPGATTAVLAGKEEAARLESACRAQSVERWFEMTVEPFRRPDGGAVITYIDITRRRHAEDEARRRREELAHAPRVTTLGGGGAA